MAIVTPPGLLAIDSHAAHQVIEDPSLIGFIEWVYLFMGVPKTALPPESPFLRLAYDESINIAYVGLQLVKNRSPWRVVSRPGPGPTPTPPMVEPPHPAHPIAPTVPPVARRVQSPSVYSIAVYNLAGHFLVNTAMDDPNADPPQVPATFWTDLRQTMSLNSFSYGIVNSASDQGTSAAQFIPDYFKDMSLFNMWLMKTPWGRMYLMIAGQWGYPMGIS